MRTAEKAIYAFIEDKPVGYKIYEMEHPDVLLWAVWALQQYAKDTIARTMPFEIRQVIGGYYELYLRS